MDWEVEFTFRVSTENPEDAARAAWEQSRFDEGPVATVRRSDGTGEPVEVDLSDIA